MAEERAGKKPRNDGDAIAAEIFPSKVMEVILMKLPAKSLARFKAVAKSWAETISSPQFNVRRRKSRPETECIVWGWPPRSETFSLMRLNLSRNKFSIDPSKYRFESPALPLCSSNGVLLLKSFCGDEMSLFLVNPTLRSESEVIKILTQRRVEDFGVNYGHYYDPRADDYKVAVISRVGSGKAYFSVYSCRNRIWSTKTPLHVGGIELEKGLFVNGCFYWWVREERFMVGLNAREGTVGMSRGPAELRSDACNLNDKIKLFEVAGRLGLYSSDKRITRLRVWTMEKDGLGACFGTWRELMNITPENEQVCLFGEEDRVVIFTDGTVRESRFLIYQHNSKCYKGIECDFPANAPWHHLIHHSETLFPLARFLQKKEETAGSSSALWSSSR